MYAKPPILGLAAAISLLGVGFASAADIYSPPPPQQEPTMAPAPAAIFSWDGLYVGIHGGWGWGDAESSTIVDMDVEGGFAGGQIGYNWQLAGIVVGIEADVSWSGIDGDRGPGVVPQTTKHELDWFGTVRGRLGIPMGRALPYVTAGVAFGEATRTTTAGGGASAEASHTGYAVGGGVEWALNQTLSAKVEYQYLDLGEETYKFPIAGPDPKVDLTAHTVRLGLNARF